jgi:predicted NBD/HSP70 family sugar kinase
MTSAIRPRLLRRMTVRRLLRIMLERGPCTRAELTRTSGISAPTVSKAVASLLEEGLLEEGQAPQGMMGRPGNVLRLARDAAQVIGVVLDVKRCVVVPAALDGSVFQSRKISFATPGTYAALLDQVTAAARQLMETPRMRTLSLGISVPGLVNRREGRAEFSPNLHLTDGHAPDADLCRRLEVDSVMFQETHALCLGEKMDRAPALLDDFVMLEISAGLGLGMMTNGRLIEGNSGLAGELGHITVDPKGRRCGCGNHGCLETVATDSALAHLVSERIGRKLDIHDVIRLVRQGEIDADAELRSVCEYLAIAIAAAINLLNPATLFVHGKLFDVRDGVFEMVCELTRRRALAPSLADCRIARARATKERGAIAAAIHQLVNRFGPVVDE